MIAVDANIVLELLEQRRHVDAVRKALNGSRQLSEEAGISVLTVSHVFYLAEAHKIPIEHAEDLTAAFRSYDVTSDDVDWALGHYKGGDFEDALQIAAALREKCTAFLTLDVQLAKKYSKFLNIKLIG